MQLIVESGGVVRCVYSEAIDLAVLGRPAITRASHVEPDQHGGWLADLSPVGGPTLGPFSHRSQALIAEQEWLEANWIDRAEPKAADTVAVRRRTWAEVGTSGWNPGHHLIGQLTECEYQGIVFWVREAVDKRTRFTTSSNERRGEKAKGPSRNRQSLELCCPEEHWERIAQLVQQADPLMRPVLHNRRFTRAWIDKQWGNGPLAWSAADRATLPEMIVLAE